MKVGILGGGQLGMMLGEAAKKLDVSCVFLDPNPESPAKNFGEFMCAAYDDAAALEKFAAECSVITYEFENVPVASVELLAKQRKIYPPAGALQQTQDRLAEKELMSSLGISVAPFAAVSSKPELQRALQEIGTPSVLKTRRMGYDGKGQMILNTEADGENAWTTFNGAPLILEGYVPFDRELSIIAVRSAEGQFLAYPLVENQHREGILRVSRAPAIDVAKELQEQAESYAKMVMQKLNYVGVMTIELFQIGDELLGNEIAPRVHNSGHWTIECAETSQFENHLRAICGLPLGSTAVKDFCAMVNVIGTMPDLKPFTTMKNAFVHDYGKAPREGRKIGHITITAKSADEREKILGDVSQFTPIA